MSTLLDDPGYSQTVDRMIESSAYTNVWGGASLAGAICGQHGSWGPLTVSDAIDVGRLGAVPELSLSSIGVAREDRIEQLSQIHRKSLATMLFAVQLERERGQLAAKLERERQDLTHSTED